MNDAWRLAPWADVLYACDEVWWDNSKPATEAFKGERWSCHNEAESVGDNKREAAARHGLKLILAGMVDGFRVPPERGIAYGVGHPNSGFQAVNLAMHFGAKRIWLLGFDLKKTKKRHFFGEHPPAIRAVKGMPNYDTFKSPFETASRMMPPGIELINATPDSGLTCFPRGTI